MVGAIFAAMSVQWTVARAVGFGVWTESLPFTRTAKGGTTAKGPDFPAFWEAVLAALLLIGAAVVVMTNYKQIHEINIFALVLVVQSLPFLAAVAIGAIEGSRFNEFAYWRERRGQGARKAAAADARRRRAGAGAGRQAGRDGAVARSDRAAGLQRNRPLYQY